MLENSILSEIDLLISLLDDLYRRSDGALKLAIRYDNRGQEQRYSGEIFAYHSAKSHAEACRNRVVAVFNREVTRDE